MKVIGLPDFQFCKIILLGGFGSLVGESRGGMGGFQKRREFREYFHGKETDYTRFDITYNTMTLSPEEIAESIINLMQTRKFI